MAGVRDDDERCESSSALLNASEKLKASSELAPLKENDEYGVCDEHLEDGMNGTESESTSDGSGPSTPGEPANGASSHEAENGTKLGSSVVEKPGDGDAENIFVMDTTFTVKIVSPGLEPFDLQLSSEELVQDVRTILVDKEETCCRTCFSLQLNGNTLDHYQELKNVEGLKDNSVIKVVEEPYTVREARLHVRHIRDLMRSSVDTSDAYSGINFSSLSFVNTILAGDADRRKQREGSIDCTPPEYIMPSCRERPLLPLHPNLKDLKAPLCVKVLTYSGWNPPPGHRKLHGDLLYLVVITLEDKKYHITASSRGFYVNQSTDEEFNPKAAGQKHLNHSLVDLLQQISPGFKKNFALLLKKRSQKHPFERIPTPYQVYSWLAPPLDHPIDYIRMEDGFSSRLGYEETIPGHTRDWNEEFQALKELPKKNLPERLNRERPIFKVNSDFVGAATRGAMSVIDGNLMAINPGEDSKMQMFIWNNIFFSLGFDVKDHYKDYGGDAAAYSAPANDLQGVRAYSELDLDGLHTLGTVIVDYKGYRITAQSIIPGILEREQEQSVVYGSIDFGKTVVTHEKYQELLKKSASQLRIRPHKVVNKEGEVIELFSSVDCKGIVGNDRRHYILDLLRTFPPDVNFFPVTDIEFSKPMVELGFPRQFKHRMPCLRSELIEAFVESRYVMFVKHAALMFQQYRLNKAKEANEKTEKSAEKSSGVERDGEKSLTSSDEDKEKEKVEEAKKLVEDLMSPQKPKEDSEEDITKEVIKKSCQFVGSLSETEFSILFNPDVYQPDVQHVDPDGEDLKKDKEMLRTAAEFVVTHQIPTFVRDCMDHSSSPVDGATLTENLHSHGINMRYLGIVTDAVGKHPQLFYIQNLCVSEMICRTAKHLYQTHMQTCDPLNMGLAISHFLNCFLSSYPTLHVVLEGLQTRTSKKKHKKRNREGTIAINDSNEWASETPKSLWAKIAEGVSGHFHFTLECDSIESALDKYGLQKVSLLRSICNKVGIQLQLREYNLENRSRPPFCEDDIINVFPVAKHVHPKATDAYRFFTSGQAKINQGMLQDGYELISESLNLLSVYGPMHPEIAACLRMLARLNYIMEDYQEALAQQQKAVIMNERCLGIDHPNTITDYAHLALYCFANNQVSSALQLFYRARFLLLLCSGENHPEVALYDSNIGLILHAVGEYELSLRFFEKAVELYKKFFGEKSLKVAMGYHLIARAHSCRGDFRAALQNEKEAYTIYKVQLGDSHDRTKESSECLKHLTQQAVVFQKKMNAIGKGDKSVNLPALQALVESIQTPSVSSVLDTLNALNGIVFMKISEEEVKRLRAQMLARQQQQQQLGKLNNSDSQSNGVDLPSPQADSEPVVNGDCCAGEINQNLHCATQVEIEVD